MTSKRRDSRPFVFVSVDMPDHPKLARIDNPLAPWLYARGIMYAGKYLTDGELPAAAVARLAGVPAKLIDELVRVGLWHREGHDCPRCPQPGPGLVIVHDYLEHNRSAAEVKEQSAKRSRAANARWHPEPAAEPAAEGPPEDAVGMHSAMHSACTTDAEAEAEAEAPPTGEPKPLLTYVGRQAVGDARASEPACLPELFARWQGIAGPNVDLEAEARAYLELHVDKPARNPRAAFEGFLRRGAENRARRAQPALVELAPVAVAPVRTFVPCPDHPQHKGAHCPECVGSSKAAPAAIVQVAKRHRERRGGRAREAS
jgi:hypothetical protein